MYQTLKRRIRKQLRGRRRKLISELLEPRLLLANDLPFQNQAQPFDVNRDLRVSSLDALQVLNFVGQNGVDFQLPDVNDSVRFPDVNGSGNVSALDALQVINLLPPELPPLLAARLANDSAPGNSENLDFITNAYGLEFAVTGADGGEQLEIRIDGSQNDPFVAAGALNGETPIAVDESQLDTIAGGALGDGLHQVEVRIAGQDRVESFVVTVDKTAPAPPSNLSLTIATDSGVSNDDGVTNVESPEVTGDAESGAVVTLSVDGEVVGQGTAGSPWQVSAGTLSEGQHTATAIAEDVAGNPSTVSDAFQFEVDITAPGTLAFDLDVVSDTAPLGDQETHVPRVNFVGQTSANVQVQVAESGQASTSDGGGAFQLTGITLGLGANVRTVRATDTAGNTRESQQTFTLQNQAPVFDSIGTLEVMPGHRLEVPLSASDADGDEVDFSIDFDGQLPSGSIANDVLMFEPVASDVGSYQFNLLARDGLESTPQSVTLNVIEDSETSTRVSGQILDTNSAALEGVRVTIGNIEEFTDADGNFELDFGRNALPGDTLRIHADELVGPNSYPFIAEKLPLLYNGREIIGGINNVIQRPIYLPALDTANATTIDPLQDMTITTPLIQGIELEIAAGTLLDQDGNEFTGDLSITAVPPDLTPAALPEGSSPDLVVTIQPGEMVFTQPAPLNFPNTGGWAPGLLMNIMSINPITGEFDDVGDAIVSEDGSMIETVSGGVLNSSWHYPEPPPPPPHFPPDEDDCDDCDLDGDFPSSVNLANGSVSDIHHLVTYQSQGRNRGLTLHYNSIQANPQPIFHFDYDDVDANRIFSVPDALQVVARASVIIDGVEIVGEGFDNPGQFGLRGGENFFSIPDGSGPLDGALQVDLSDQPTGIYSRTMQVGLRGFTGTRFIGSSTILGDEFVLVNSSDSPFGSGWGLAGLQEIVEGPDGSVAIIDGDGDVLRWEPGVRQVQDFLASDQTDESVKRFDGRTGALLGDFVQPGAGGVNNPHNPTIGPDGNLYVVSDAAGPNPQILRYDGETGEFLDVFVDNGEGGFDGSSEQLFATDGTLYLATVSGLGVLRYDQFGNFIDSIAGPADGVQAACGIEFGPDGLLYVWDTSDEEMRRFDPETGDLVDVFIPSGDMANACDWDFGIDGDIFITDLTFSEIRRFSGVDGSFLGTFADTDPGASGITFGPDGDFYVNVAGNTHQFDGQTGEFTREFVPGLGGFNNFFPPPPEGITSEFISPAGDFSTLHRREDGLYTRTMPNLTVFLFNADNKLDRITDRNGNVTRYMYDQDDNLTKIIDPVGLETTFAYDNGRVSMITDPANRETVLEYDDAGNLIRITDPDDTSRSFTYDERHLMTGETNKRGDQEFEFYDEFGRATGAMFADGTVVEVTPRHVRGLHSPELTSDPNNPAPATRGHVDTTYVDGNGNTFTTVMDAAGQVVSASDEEGLLATFQRDPQTNLVTSRTDARGNITQFTYDDRGNLSSIIDSINSGRLALAGRLPIESFEIAFAAPDTLRGVAADTSHVYVFGDGGVHTVDVSDPTNPFRTSVDFVNGSDFGIVEGTRLLGVSGGSTATGFSDLHYLDLTGDGSPQDPDPRGLLPTAYVVGDDIVTSGDFAFVSYRQFRRMGANDIFEQNGTVASFDISDPDNPALADLLFNTNGATNEPPVVSMGGNFLVGGLAIADPTTLYVGSTTATGTDTQTGEAALLVVDITDPTAINSDGGGGGLDSVLSLPGVTLISDILVDGDTAYVLGSQGGLLDNSPDSSDIGPTGNVTLTSLDISDARSPSIIRTHFLPLPASGVFDGDDQRLVQIGDDLIATFMDANVDSGPMIVTLDVTNLNNIRIDQRIPLQFEPRGIDASDTAVYVTTANGLEIYNIRPPETVGRPPEFVYHPSFNVLSGKTDEFGRQTFFQISPFNGNTLSITQQIGAVGGDDDLVTELTYVADGQIDTVTDAEGRVTDYDYDQLGRTVRIMFAKGTSDEATREFEYDDAGNLTAIIDEKGNRAEAEYDSMNRITRIVDPDPDGAGELTSPVTTFDYDLAGNLTETVDARSNKTEFTYDLLNRRIGILDADDGLTRLSYDNVGNVLSLTDPLNQQTQFLYDTRNRHIETIDPTGGQTRLTYDADNNVATITDPNDNITTYQYDARSRLLETIDPLNNSTTFTYDPADNLISRVDREGREITLAYDDLNRLVTETWVGDGNAIQYEYDNVGNLLSASDNFSSVVATYDNRDRVLTVDNTGTPNAPAVVVSYTYDNNNNVLTTTDNINGQDAGGTTYAYDGLNRLTRISETDSGSTGVSDKAVDFTYNDVGRFETITRYADLTNTQVVAESNYQYDGLNRLVSLDHHNSTDSIAEYQFRYDAASRLEFVQDAQGRTNYAYDQKHQLVSSDHVSAVNPDETFAYDPGGNRIDSHLHGQNYSTGTGNQLLSDGTFDYDYDAEGNLISRTDIGSGEVREFTWDYRNRLVVVVDKDASDQQLQRVTYAYDGVNRRIAKEVESAVDNVITHYVYDYDRVRLDFVDEDGPAPANAPELVQRYLHGPAVDQVLAQDDDQGNVQWLLGDQLGSIRDVVDANGDPISHLVYDSSGNLIDQTGSEMPRYQFTGREFDTETGLYFYRARYLDTSTGRFLSEDPIGFAGGQTNLFTYVGNNPINFRDPSGLQGGFSGSNVGSGGFGGSNIGSGGFGGSNIGSGGFGGSNIGSGGFGGSNIGSGGFGGSNIGGAGPFGQTLQPPSHVGGPFGTTNQTTNNPGGSNTGGNNGLGDGPGNNPFDGGPGNNGPNNNNLPPPPYEPPPGSAWQAVYDHCGNFLYWALVYI